MDTRKYYHCLPRSIQYGFSLFQNRCTCNEPRFLLGRRRKSLDVIPRECVIVGLDRRNGVVFMTQVRLPIEMGE